MGDKNRLVKATNLLDENVVEFSYDVLNRRFLLRQGFEGQVPKITKTYIYSNENILQETTTDTVTNTTKTRDYIN
ncbi:MAG: hypothetical protein Q8S84_03830 [bacterium]|nr:hypothetical protein [bacterium]